MAEIADNHIAALVILVVSGCGMCANWFIVLFISRLKTLQNPFGWLSRAQSSVEAIHNSLFCFYYVPMVYFDVSWMKEHSGYSGQFILGCYDLTVFMHLLISLNRMCAVFAPLKYTDIFSFRHTMLAIVFVFIVEVSSSIYFFNIQNCQFFYAGDFYQFTFANNSICLFIAWYADFLRNVSMVILICTIDVITVAKVHIRRRATNNTIPSETVKRRRDQEINFLKQACFQAIIFVCELITYFVLVLKFENKWAKFSLTTVAWNLVHCIDGCITLIFNSEFRIFFPFIKSAYTRNST